jgi:hypothetical protein
MKGIAEFNPSAIVRGSAATIIEQRSLTMLKNETIGVRLPGETRQKIAKHASVLSIPQSSFIRVLLTLAIEEIEKNPSLLLKRTGGSFPADN